MDVIDYGVCRLALVPIRKEPRDTAEQVTQLLFGDHYEVNEISADKHWLRITIYSDRAEGWLDARQHHAISSEYFDQINQTDFKITTEVASAVLYKKSPLTIVMGSIVPISNSELFKIEEQFAFNGEAKGLGQKRDAEYVRTIARKYLSAPYQWGGKSPFGIDASGLTQMVFRIAGYSLHRDVRQQSIQGKKVGHWSELQPGDLAFFAEKASTVKHVGIVLDDSRVIHAYGQVRLDTLTEEGIRHAESGAITHHLHSIRRILP
jgi:hypothetical protein